VEVVRYTSQDNLYWSITMQNQPQMPRSFDENPHYVFKDGHYAFYAYGRKLCDDLPAVALLFDHKHRVIINHGSAVFARERLAVVQRMYIDGGLASDDVVLLEGQFPVDELNAAISIPGRIGDLYAKVQALNALRADEVVQALISRMSTGACFAATAR
jgi:hypothetical protein